MASTQSLLFCFISSILVLAFALSCSASNEDREVYIAYLGSLPQGGKISPSSQHLNMLQQVTGMSSSEDSLVRSYGRSFNGFAAKLTKDEKQKLASMKGVVSVFPSKVLKLKTTRSWDFLGLKETISRNVKVESDIVVGVIDTGIWPESDSFKDDGFGPAPKKWKGVCKGGANFTCNNKIIGARFYPSESARDDDGHGTHTASTAAGNKVSDASFYGLAKGTARGGVPSSRIAVYKVCDTKGCQDSDILAGFDDAIADGVDIISISLGPDSAIQFEVDSIAIGAFHAMARGILALQSAGNEGPYGGSLGSLAPWIFSVGASTIDRQFIDKVVLGNGRELVGISVNSFTLNGTKFPLITGKQASLSSCNETSARSCLAKCLNETLVKGKIIACADDKFAYIPAQGAGALGSILELSDEEYDSPFVVSLPASVLNGGDYSAVMSYINSTKNPEANILRTEEIKDSSAPLVVSFSSRGPNTIIPEILKPDICAPGNNILAAYSPLGLPSRSEYDKRRVQYSIVSGTSMACPHAAGVAAYVKSFHPDWSPSAIKSAIMTTASRMDRAKHKKAEFDYGSGNINPVKAISPGLVYEASKEDYIKMLCNAGYSVEKVRLISGDKNSTCQDGSVKGSPKDLNYPSMTATVAPKKPFEVVFNRTVTNVGFSNSTYKLHVSSDKKVSVKVVPDVLAFKSLHEKKTFTVKVSGPGMPKSKMVSASVTWSDGTHSVRSPVIAYTFSPDKTPLA